MAKVSFRSAEKQAAHAVRQISATGTSRHENMNDGKLHSIGTQRNYAQALKGLTAFIQENKMGDLKSLTAEIAVAYLEARGQEVGQKTLDLDRQAMQSVLEQELPAVRSELASALSSRAYTHEQTQIVAGAQSDKHNLPTPIVENAGLRAHELLTLRPVEERPADTHREYRHDRFEGRENVKIYTVLGKGGLCREVAIDRGLAEKLEERRLDTPRIVYDRGIRYEQHYSIGGGKQWSDSFSKASQRGLGWSAGGHGLRHTYAQERMATLQGAGYNYQEALEVVSQEMGHFRGDITEVYLR